MPIRAILLDKDGTLVDFHNTWEPAYREATAHIATARVPARHLLALGGMVDDRVQPNTVLASGTNDEIAALWLGALGLPLDHPHHARIHEIFHRHVTRGAPVRGLLPALGRLHGQGYRLGVATMDTTRGAVDSIAWLGLGHLIDFVVGYDAGVGEKPGPGMVLAFCAAVGVSPHEVCVVGDSLHDLRMARAAGAGLAIGVLTGPAQRDDLADQADLIIDGVGVLPEALEALG